MLCSTKGCVDVVHHRASFESVISLACTPFVSSWSLNWLRTAFRTACTLLSLREEREGNPVKEKLIEQLTYVQSRIKEITLHERIEIKQISDLQRYFEMQRNIVESLYRISGGNVV